VIVALMKGHRGFAAASGGVGAVAMAISAALVAHALPSKHGVSTIVFDALKVAYNSCYNLLGLEFWTNTNADSIKTTPIWVVNLPPWLHLGNIRQFGYCGFDWRRPADVVILLGSAFGTLPILLLRRNLFTRIWKSDLTVTVAALYGLLMLVLAPLAAHGARYFLYAWPLFWLFGVVLLSERTWNRPLYAFAAVSLVAAWTHALILFFSAGPLVGAVSLFSGTGSPRVKLVCLILVLGEQMLAFEFLKSSAARSVATTEIPGTT